MQTPKVSVIMGIYNCDQTLRESIESIINQTYNNWELILCDDASTDGSYQIAEQYALAYPDKIRLLRNQRNLRLSAALNRCLAHASGEYIARMDGDDISLPERLDRQVEFLEAHPEYQVVGTNMFSFDERGVRGIRRTMEIPGKTELRYGTPFAHATVMMRKYAYDALGGYREGDEVTRCEDLDLWFRFFAERFQGYNLQLPLYKVREGVPGFRRRNFLSSIKVAKVCYRGFRLLGYPRRYYLFLLKPILAALLPSSLMKYYHNRRDRQAQIRLESQWIKSWKGN